MLPLGTDKQTVSYEHGLHSGRIEEQIKKNILFEIHCFISFEFWVAAGVKRPV